METKRILIEDIKNPKDQELEEAAQILRSGGLVAFPTETVYGLGGNALDENAARKIYSAKGRPSDNPLIVHISSMEELCPLVKEISETAKVLAEAYWPGPLTMVFNKSEIVPYETTGGLETVAIRMPSDPTARKLIHLAKVPIAAPSANTSGRPSPTTAEHVWQDLEGRIDAVIDGGSVGIGLESTIVDVSGKTPVVLRPGAVTLEMLSGQLGYIKVDRTIFMPMTEGTVPKAPGMKYKHYAPKGELTLIQLTDETVCDLYDKKSSLYRQVSDIREKNQVSPNLESENIYMALQADQEALKRAETGAKTGVICTDETADLYQTPIKRSIGSRFNEESIARNLYAVLREFDDLGIEYIYSESFPSEHLGIAIMNRLNKASGYHVLEV